MTPAGSLTTISVEQTLLDAIVSPYKENCKYLKRVTVEVPADGELSKGEDAFLARAHGEFEIPESWYIDETGHFNSIEFNLCYNQLVYVLIGQCVASKLLPELSRMSLEEYRRRQLPDVLIARLSSVFKKAMDSRSFRGTVSIRSISDRKRMMLLKTHCFFEDLEGGFSEGDITLAIVNRAHGA